MDGKLLKSKVESIMGDFVQEINPINLESGAKLECTDDEFVVAWDKAVQRIVDLKK